MTVVVRWESAKPIQEAEKRLQNNNAQPDGDYFDNVQFVNQPDTWATQPGWPR